MDILSPMICGMLHVVLLLVYNGSPQVQADYPPHELEYRIHPIELFPREATHSLFCQSHPDGNYPHDNLDLGDPRCTFIMCTNKRTVVHSCPAGTRTGRFYLPEYYPKAFYFARKYGKYDKYIPSYQSLESRFREDFRNHQSTHGICDYFDVGGVCGSLYPDYNAFVREEEIRPGHSQVLTDKRIKSVLDH